jgi:hypothetical protein
MKDEMNWRERENGSSAAVKVLHSLATTAAGKQQENSFLVCLSIDTITILPSIYLSTLHIYI